MNILVVDDHPLYRSGVVYTLQNTGMDVEVVECASLEAALRDESLHGERGIGLTRVLERSVWAGEVDDYVGVAEDVVQSRCECRVRTARELHVVRVEAARDLERGLQLLMRHDGLAAGIELHPPR